MLITARLSPMFYLRMGRRSHFFMMKFLRLLPMTKRQDVSGGDCKKKYRCLHFRPLPGVGCRNCPRWVYSCSGTSVKPLIPLYPLKRILVIRMYLPFPGYGNEWIGSGCVCCSSYAFRKQRMALSLLLLNLSTTHYH